MTTGVFSQIYQSLDRLKSQQFNLEECFPKDPPESSYAIIKATSPCKDNYTTSVVKKILDHALPSLAHNPEETDPHIYFSVKVGSPAIQLSQTLTSKESRSPIVTFDPEFIRTVKDQVNEYAKNFMIYLQSIREGCNKAKDPFYENKTCMIPYRYGVLMEEIYHKKHPEEEKRGVKFHPFSDNGIKMMNIQGDPEALENFVDKVNGEVLPTLVGDCCHYLAKEDLKLPKKDLRGNSDLFSGLPEELSNRVAEEKRNISQKSIQEIYICGALPSFAYDDTIFQ